LDINKFLKKKKVKKKNLNRLLALKMKINEARNFNNKEVIAEE